MQPLLRPEFRPKLWSAADLDAAARHWLWLFTQAPATAGRAADHRTDLRLRGFPGAGREAVAAALAARLPDAEVTRPDPDTLAATGPVLDFETPPPAGLGVPSLAGPPFDGLYLEVRLTASAWKRNGKPRAAGTLVLAGGLGPGGLTVYSVWAEVGSALVDRAMVSAPWLGEAAWRRSLDDYQTGGGDESSARALAGSLFLPVTSARRVNAFVWLVTMPLPPGPRRAGALARLAVNSAAFAVAVTFAALVADSSALGVASRVTLVAFSAATLGLFLRRLVIEWVQTKRILTGNFRALYAGSTRIVAADAATAAGFCDNPCGRKSAADWEAAGCRRVADATLENPGGQQAGYRVFHAPDGVTHVALIAMTEVSGPGGAVLFRQWPALVVPALFTRFPGGGVATTLTDPSAGFRRKLSGPESVARVHPGVSDPAELLTRHAELCQEYAGRTGSTASPALGFDALRQWQLELLDRERTLYAHNLVTWSDAFVLLMGYVRRAYR